MIIMTTRAPMGISPYVGSLCRRPIDPFDPFGVLDRIGDLSSAMTEMSHAMRSDVKETDDAYEVKVDLPGVDKSDIDVQFDEESGVLTVGYEHAAESGKDEDDANGWIVRERSCVAGKRTFALSGVTKDGIKAKYEDGVLSVTVAKDKSEKKPSQSSIEVE